MARYPADSNLPAASGEPVLADRPCPIAVGLEVHLEELAGRRSAHDDELEALTQGRVKNCGSYRKAMSMPRSSLVSAWTT